MDVPKISIVTVTFNSLDDLRYTVREVAARLAGLLVEHVIVDGGSTDGTVAFIGGLSYGQSSVSYVVRSQCDDGIYDAMNAGLDMASGEYVWFLNAGDAPAEPTWFEMFRVKSEDVDVFFGDTILVDHEFRKVATSMAPRRFHPKEILKGVVVSHQSVIARRHLAPKYLQSYRYLADQQWLFGVFSRSRCSIHLGCELSKYKLGGLSESRLWACVLEKVKLNFVNFRPLPATYQSCLDLGKGLRRYAGVVARRML